MILLSPFRSRDDARSVNSAMVLVSLAADQLSAPTSTGSAVSPEPSGPGLRQLPHGWTIAFQPQLFARLSVERKVEVTRLRQELDPQAFVPHPQVKRLAAVMEGI